MACENGAVGSTLPHVVLVQKNFIRALSDFNRAVKYDPSAVLSWNHIGLCLNAIGRSEEVRCFTRVVSAYSIAPHGVASHNVCDMLFVSRFVVRLSVNVQALEAHSRALALNKEFKEALVNMGQACKELGRGEDALSYFQSVCGHRCEAR